MPALRKSSRLSRATPLPLATLDGRPVAPRSQQDAAARELRGSPRHPVAIPVAVKFNSSGQYEFSSVSRDLSETGIFLHFDQPVAVGEEVTLRLSLPTGNAMPHGMTIHGNVARVEQISVPGIAVAFRELVVDPSQAAALE